MSRKRRFYKKIKPTKQPSEIKTTNNNKKYSKSNFLFIGIIAIGIIGLILVHFEFFSISYDDKNEPFHRIYYVTQIFDMGIKETDEGILEGAFIEKDDGGFAKLIGTVYFDTNSRSARNPIEVKINLDFASESLPLPTDWKELPNTLHFVFPEAKYYEKDNDSKSNEVEIKLEKLQRNIPSYFGSEKIIYEDEGEKEFFLREAKEQEDNIRIIVNEYGNLDMFFEYDVSNDPSQLGTKIFEINALENKKLVIQPYLQTLVLWIYKGGILSVFIGMLIAGTIALVSHNKKQSPTNPN